VTATSTAFEELLDLQMGSRFVRVGAGCTLQLLDKLHATTDQTLPTLGAVKKQTIAGAISTGTHGSGRQSLSHFVANVRIAAYDSAGRATIYGALCQRNDPAGVFRNTYTARVLGLAPGRS